MKAAAQVERLLGSDHPAPPPEFSE
jgi:hypothetical protein